MEKNQAKTYETKEIEERVVLIGIDNEKDLMNIDASLDELAHKAPVCFGLVKYWMINIF